MRTAEDNATDFLPEVISTVNHNFYVEDCLKSTASEGDAIQLVKDLTLLQRWTQSSKMGYKQRFYVDVDPE